MARNHDPQPGTARGKDAQAAYRGATKGSTESLLDHPKLPRDVKAKLAGPNAPRLRIDRSRLIPIER